MGEGMWALQGTIQECPFLFLWAFVKCEGDESPKSGTQSFDMFKDQTLSLCFTTILCHIFLYYPHLQRKEFEAQRLKWFSRSHIPEKAAEPGWQCKSSCTGRDWGHYSWITDSIQIEIQHLWHALPGGLPNFHGKRNAVGEETATGRGVKEWGQQPSWFWWPRCIPIQ